jgi:hypothetical protein
MAGEDHVLLEPEDGWYKLDIRVHNGGILIQVWSTVAAVDPELSPEPSADGLAWLWESPL